MPYFLQLVSLGAGGVVKGYTKDPDWAGWIPIQSFSFRGSNAASGSYSNRRPAGEPKEIDLIAAMADLDVAILYQIAAQGTACRATLNVVPDTIGEHGQRMTFTDAVVSSVQNGGMAVSFSLNFGSMEWLQSVRFR